MPIHNIDWKDIFNKLTPRLENKYNISLSIDAVILEEINERALLTLNSLNMDTTPNVAKVAGHVSFWIRKLKPLSHKENSLDHYTAINEFAGLLVGLGICDDYFDDLNGQKIAIDGRILQDWVHSMRLNSHSPNSTAISFEMLASQSPK